MNLKEKKPNEESLEIVWEQVFPPDADLRIQRAFEMLFDEAEPDGQNEIEELC